MSLSGYYCGLCLESYALKKGCVVCEPAKARITNADTNAKLDPIEGVNQALRIFRDLLNELEEELQSETTTPQRKLDMVKDLGKLSDSSAKLLDAKRKYEAAEPDTGGFDNEAATFLDWIDGLPPEERSQLISRVGGLALLPPAPPGVEEAEIVPVEE